MSLTTAALEVLVAKGLSAQDILDISRALDVKSDPTAAERKRRQRQKEADEREEMSQRDVTRDTPFPAPPNENNLTPPTHTPENNKPARVRGSRLPADWQPKTLTGDAGVAVRSWPAGSVDRELARFRDWAASATGPNALKTDWDAAWRNWIRKAEDDGRYGPRPSGRATPGTPGSFLAHLAGQSP